MDKRGVADNVLLGNIIYIILGILFFIGMFYFVMGYQDGAAFYEDFFSKEIARLINVANPGQEVYLDVTEIVGIALGNGKKKEEIFIFDNINNEVIVSLRQGTGASFSFFNEVDVVESRVELVSGSANTNRLYFKIKEAGK
ncbi:TPA: hypothetical protein EYQ19_02040 [Candidatus Pacearchaeota archaeon]|jgi:hypothetical protein|nr:hypothetical protein [Candidatus Pacearchaeota archaeon]